MRFNFEKAGCWETFSFDTQNTTGDFANKDPNRRSMMTLVIINYEL